MRVNEKHERHEEILRSLEDEYHLSGEIDAPFEFTEDGPSYWEKYLDVNTPRIVFLTKESHSSFHPSTPCVVRGKFLKNIANWASLILDINRNKKDLFNNKIQEAYNTIAIVEVKKVDEDKQSSVHADIKKFAWLGREFLKKQLEVLEPHIVICCGTIDYFDIIYNYSDQEKLLLEKEIYFNGNLKCWISDNKLVVKFFHPTARRSPDKMLDEIKAFVTNDIVQLAYLDIISKDRFIN